MSERRYHVTVDVTEPNPDYKDWAAYGAYNQTDPRAPHERDREIRLQTLSVILTEAEYTAMKRAILETFP